MLEIIDAINAQCDLARAVEDIVIDDIDIIHRRRFINRIGSMMEVFGGKWERIPESVGMVTRRDLLCHAYFNEDKRWILPMVAAYGQVE